MKKNYSKIIMVFVFFIGLISLSKLDKSTNKRAAKLRSDIRIAQLSKEPTEDIEKVLRRADEKRIKAFVKEKMRKEKEKIDKDASQYVRNLQADFPQVKARIIINGTEIDFPVVQGEDNEFYLDHDYDNSYYINGGVFIDHLHQPDFSDQNTVIYGHNVRIGYIFHDLDKFRDPDFVKTNSEIIIDTPEKRRVFDVIAAMDIKEDADYRFYEYTDEEFEGYLDLIRENNILEGKPLPTKKDKLLTLSTCSDISDRYAIVAVERYEKVKDETDLRKALALLAQDGSDRHVY